MGKLRQKPAKRRETTAPALCPVEAIDARVAGINLAVVARKLGEFGILTNAGVRILENEGRRIARLNAERSWTLLIDPSDKVTFEWTKDKNGEPVQPWLSAHVTVDQTNPDRPPFSALDIAVQLDRLDDTPVARWHVDLANGDGETFQAGPLFHLQFGGHQQGFRELDHPLKAPRWCHPPIEAGLMCEIIAANFYESEWLGLREDVTWCEAIGQFQKLCYPAYFNKMAKTLAMSRTTMLNQVWAADWAKALQAARAS